MNRLLNLKIWLIVGLLCLNFTCKTNASKTSDTKPTICIVGGTPSTTEILNFIPDSLKAKYNFISFNRPGFGDAKYEETTEDLIYKLAKNAGLKEHDYGVIGISGGGP